MDEPTRGSNSIVKPFVSPGRLTRDYFEGAPPLWKSLVRLYLIVGVVYFAVTVAGQAGQSFEVSTENSATAAVRDLVLTREEQTQDAVGHALATWMPAALFSLLPLLAALLGIAFRRSGYRYAHHAHLALTLLAVWFAAAAIDAIAHAVDPAIGFVRPIAIAYGVWYYFRSLRVAYGRTRRAALWRMIAFGVVYCLLSVGAVLAIAAPLISMRR